MKLTDINFARFIIVYFCKNFLDFFVLLDLLPGFEILGLSSTPVPLFEPSDGVLRVQNIAFAGSVSGCQRLCSRLGSCIGS